MLLVASAPLPHKKGFLPFLRPSKVSFLLPNFDDLTSDPSEAVDLLLEKPFLPISSVTCSTSLENKENREPLENQHIETNVNSSVIFKEKEEKQEKELELENNWCFWYDKYPGPGLSPQQYKSALRQLGSFDSIPEFWKWYNNLQSPEKLGPRTSYHLMKKGVYPLWEDEANCNGGEITVKIEKGDTNRAWIATLLAIIGEQFDHLLASGDEICGASVNVRRNETCISIWNRSSNIDRTAAELALLKTLKGVHFKEVSYKVHKDELSQVSH